MGYSITYIKYIKYSGLGMDSNIFLRFLNIFGHCWTIRDTTRKMPGAKRPTFFEKSNSHMSPQAKPPS